MRTVLLTDWTGPVAYALVGRLVGLGVRTTVLARDPFAARRSLPREVTAATVPGMDKGRVAAVLAGFDLVVDNRVLPRPRRGAHALGAIYLRETRVILAAAEAAGIPRLVHVRALQDGRAHGWAHRRVDEALVRADLSTARVELAPVFGPEAGVSTDLNAFLLRSLLGGLPNVSVGATDLLFSDAAAAAILDVACDPTRSFTTLAGSRHTYREIAGIVADLRGTRPPRVLPRPLARLLVDLAPPTRHPPLPPCRFDAFVHDPADRARWPTAALRADIAATAAHFLSAPAHAVE